MRAIPRYPRPKERYERFTLNPESPLYNGLMWAGLGNGVAPGSSRFEDSSPYALHGRFSGYLNNAWVWSRELGRWANRFSDSASAPVMVDHRSTYPAYQDIALACWVKSTQNEEYIGVIANSDAARGVGIITENHSTKLRVWCNNVFADSTKPIANGNWNHTITQRVGAALYGIINGGEEVLTKSGGAIGNAFTPINLTYGSWGSDSYKFVGDAADPLIFRRALTDAETKALADPTNVDLRVGGVPLIVPARRRWWPGVSIEDIVAPKRVPWHLLVQGAV